MQEYVNFLYFLQLFGRYSLFFSPGRDQLLGRAGQKNISPGISPRISPLLNFWIPGLDSYIWLGRYAWAKSLVSRAILVQVYYKQPYHTLISVTQCIYQLCTFTCHGPLLLFQWLCWFSTPTCYIHFLLFQCLCWFSTPTCYIHFLLFQCLCWFSTPTCNTHF